MAPIINSAKVFRLVFREVDLERVFFAKVGCLMKGVSLHHIIVRHVTRVAKSKDRPDDRRRETRVTTIGIKTTQYRNEDGFEGRPLKDVVKSHPKDVRVDSRKEADAKRVDREGKPGVKEVLARLIQFSSFDAVKETAGRDSGLSTGCTLSETAR
ncbi:hypothetical protein EI94DRAFT_1700265 [Lactarius quietus]|nr:hypothetical protein EI94DRAFT_1700265 [Lactarius quietus]